MSDALIEIVPEGTAPTDAEASLYEWPVAPGRTATMHAGIDWHVSQFPGSTVAAKDLLRVVAAAYVADRVASQSSIRLARTLLLTVHVEQPDAWTDDARERTVDLLHWLTGDDWGLRLVPAAAPAPGTTASLDLHVVGADDISLLSGGLDSLCGALIRIREPGQVVFLGHADSSTAVRRAQHRLQEHLARQVPSRRYLQYPLRPLGGVPNRTPKTRSLLFMSMAVAAASSTGARRVLVPENGFTSINPPLEPSRAGVMTTRSTHPWTFHALSGLLASLGLTGIEVVNPHSSLTKGELLKQAMPKATGDDQALAAATLSCAKPNAGRPPRGDPNKQCGLCIACLVRRASFIAAGVPDLTPYAATDPIASLRDQVFKARRHDTAAWKAATTVGIEEHRVIGSGLWPPGTDFNAVLAMCDRGLKELSRVPS